MISGIHWLDWTALGLVALLGFRGYRQGLILQLATFLAIGLGLLGGLHLQDAALPLLPDFEMPRLRFAASFALVFASIALSVNVVSRLLRKAVHALFLGWIDRLLGGVFGVLVGLQVLLAAVLLIGRYLPKGVGWLQESVVAPGMLAISARLLPLLPQQFTRFFEHRFGDLI